MRSSVSVILSNPPPDTNMSYPDYSAHPYHHHTLFLLVKQVGTQLKSHVFHKLYERINKVTEIKVNDSSGTPRPVWVTYRKDYPVENNDWGEFQAHRRILGIITVGHVNNQTDLNIVCKEHESLKVKYSSTLYHSRCIILGLNPDFSVYQPNDHQVLSNNSSSDCFQKTSHVNCSNTSFPSQNNQVPSSVNDRDSGVYESSVAADNCHTNEATADQGTATANGKVNCSSSDSGSECTNEIITEESKNTVSNPSSSTYTSGQEGTDVPNLPKPLSLQPPHLQQSIRTYLCYQTVDHALNIEGPIQEFISSLFWVLEYKRMEKLQEKVDRPQFLCAPFERKDFVGLDLDSRTNKKRCSGRIKKHLADLSLQAGLLTDALVQYSVAADILKGCNDWLWLAACYEGLCAASVMTLYPQLYRKNTLQRYASIGANGALCGGSFSHGARNRSGSISTNSLPTGLEPAAVKQISKYCLSPEDIVEKYREAIVHYSKYRNAGVIETEASIKAVHVLIEQRKYLQAAEFLSNVVFINLQLSDVEKITRFTALADLYHQIGFHRKAAFFIRVAAMRCVAPQNPQPNWNQCYKLLLLTLDGYRLALDPIQFMEDGRPGWPALQIQILHELKGTCQRMGAHEFSTRHQAFLLTAMFFYLTNNERIDAFNMLEMLSSKSTVNAPLAVNDCAIILPPVSMINIPLCRSVQILPPSKERQIERRDDCYSDTQGPFIFSPFQSLTAVKIPGKTDHEWVEGDVCEVVLSLENPLPFQLKLSSLMLLTEGAKFESWTSTVALEPGQNEQVVSLRGRPQESGELRVYGYSVCVAGVTSMCRFKNLSHLKVPFYSLSIVPAFPRVQIFCDCVSENDSINNEDFEERGHVSLSLTAGETKECTITLQNVSSKPVEKVEIDINSNFDQEIPEKIFDFDARNLEEQLPLLPGQRASFTLSIYAASMFLFQGFSLSDDTLHISGGGSQLPSLTSTGQPPSLSSQHSNLMSSFRSSKRKNAHNSLSFVSSSHSSISFRSNSSNSLVGTEQTTLQNPSLSQQNLGGCVKLSYTGASGVQTNSWRVSFISLNVDVVPSLLVTRWDAIPSEVPMQCYIVLDFLNASNYEMDLYYTPNRNIIIQSKESCRVPVPVDRCPIAKLNECGEENEVKNLGVILGDHVASLVNLRWQLLPINVFGHTTLKSIAFPSQMYHLIAMAPIQWDVQLDGVPIEGGSENPGILGDLLEFNVTVTNTSDSHLPSVTLSLVTFQDHQNGFCNHRLEAKMAVIGTAKIAIPQLAPNSSFSHSLKLVFFTSGIYKIEFNCSVVNSPEINPSQGANYESVSSCYRTWKLAPPIELSISDS